MAWNYSNTAAQTALTASITNADTSCVVGSVTGFPASFSYSVVIDYGQTTAEVVTVTNVAGTTLTITRGQDGTSAQSHGNGAVVRHAAVARDWREPSVHIDATVDVHGLSGGAAIVGTLSTQTLTNKTLTSPIINGGTVATATVDNTNTVTLKDTNLTIQDDGDTTKQAKFQLSGITTGTTRTLTVPDVSDTLVTLTATQTLTNKTLTSPVVTGIGQVLTAYKTANETVNNTAALQDDDHLFVSVEANAVYIVEAFLSYASNTTADFKIGWTGPAGASMEWSPWGQGTGASSSEGTISVAMSNLATPQALGGTGANVSARPVGMFFTAGNAGTYRLQWAQNTADASNTTLNFPSWLRLRRIA